MSSKNKKQNKKLIMYVIIILIITIIFIIPTSREKIFSRSNLFSKPERELLLINEFNMDRAIEEIDIDYDRIIAFKDKKIFFWDFNGFELLKKDFNFEELDVIFGKDIIYAMDKSLGKLHLLNKEGKTVEKIDLKTPFDKLKEEGENIYIYRKDGDAEYIDIIDRKGSIIKAHEERIPILTLSMRDDGQEYMVATLDIDKKVNSLLDSYSIEGENIENIKFKDEVIVYSQYVGKRIVLASEKNIYLLKNGSIKWEKKIKNLKDIKVRNNKIYVLYNDKFEILSLRGKIKEEFKVNIDLENIRFIKEDVLLFGKRDILIPQNKNDILKFKADSDILNLKYNEENLLIEKEGKVEIYKLKEKGDK